MSLEPITSSAAPSDEEQAQRLAGTEQKIRALNADVCRMVDQIDRWNGRAGAAPTGQVPTDATTIEQLDGQIAALAGSVRGLEARLRGLEDLSLVAPRKPMHVRLAEMLVGPEYYRPWWRKSGLPGATIVVPAGEDEATAATVRSVLAQSGHGWDAIIVGPEPGPRLRQAIEASAGRVRHVPANGPVWECLDKGLGNATGSGGG
ncbi:MAG TPA: hypothetical protein VHY37_08380, partial [Tepidisphaeraceae bacterium]|nr:hypothetical protein [Tepidisphaeraceae bacterium]